MKVIELTLNNYRNFTNFKFSTEGKPVIILGPNGVGKTNILEAISLLSPGKGLKNARFEDIKKNGSESDKYSWQVTAKIASNLGNIELSSHFKSKKNSIGYNILAENEDEDNLSYQNKRNIFFNGSKISSVELADLSSISWLTPHMCYLFIAPTQERRRFFDRLVCNFDGEHLSRLYKYEYYIKERNLFLQSALYNKSTSKILDNIEEKIAQNAVAICFARLQVLHTIQSTINVFTDQFPKARLELKGDLESVVDIHTALELEKIILQNMFDNRILDSNTKKANFGPHRTDLVAYHPNNNPAALCSTGEQKSLLISIILAELTAKEAWSGNKPIILLDEIMVHLDQTRRTSLLQHLCDSQIQYWITANSANQVEYNSDVFVLDLNY